MYLGVPRRCRRSTASSPSTASCASRRRTTPSECSSQSTAPRRAESRTRRCRSRPADGQRRPPPRQHPLRRRQPRGAGRVVHRRGSGRPRSTELGVQLTPELAEPLYTALVTDTGRFQYANTTPKALRLAADLVEAGADAHKVFQGVYETVQFAKLKLLARALERAPGVRGRPGRRLLSAAQRLPGGRRRRALLGGHHRPPAGGRGRGACGADPRAPAGGRPAAQGVAALLRGRDRRLGDRAQARRRRPSSGRGLRHRRVARGHRALPRDRVRGDRGPGGARRPRPPPASGHPASRSSRPGSSSSTSLRAPLRHAALARVRSRTGARTGHAGTLDPFATGLLVLLSGRATGSHSASSGSTSAT